MRCQVPASACLIFRSLPTGSPLECIRGRACTYRCQTPEASIAALIIMAGPCSISSLFFACFTGPCCAAPSGGATAARSVSRPACAACWAADVRDTAGRLLSTGGASKKRAASSTLPRRREKPHRKRGAPASMEIRIVFGRAHLQEG